MNLRFQMCYLKNCSGREFEGLFFLISALAKLYCPGETILRLSFLVEWLGFKKTAGDPWGVQAFLS